MSEATGETPDPDAGYQGDVQPFVALPRGLANAGHEAVLAAPHRFEGFARDQGVPCAGIDDCWSVAPEGPGAGVASWSEPIRRRQAAVPLTSASVGSRGSVIRSASVPPWASHSCAKVWRSW